MTQTKETDRLPDAVVHIETLRYKRNAEKRCQCKNKTYIVDDANREVRCEECGGLVDPFDAISDLARHYDKLNREIDALYAQKKELSEFQPHIKVVRELDRQYRGKKMLPCCPHCHKGIYLEEITSWTGRQYEEHRRFQEQHAIKEESHHNDASTNCTQ